MKTSPKRLEYIRQWRAANQNKVTDYSRRFAGKPEVKKRHIENMRRWRRMNPERVKENYRRRRAANPEVFRLRFRNLKLKKHYGITLADYDRMLAEQNGVCAICGGLQDKAFPWRLSVDHDNETGHVRQLLCTLCNTGLGAFTHSPEKLKAAIAYLEKHKEAKCR